MARLTGTGAGATVAARRLSWAWPLSREMGLLLGIGAVALALRLWPIGGVALDYQDEGVYWQSLRSMAGGQPLFSAIFSSQPPFFLLGLYPFYLLFGGTLVAARLGVMLYSLLGLVATYCTGRAVGGRWTGVVACAVLVADPLYLTESHTLQAEMPALALAGAGVALAAAAARALVTRGMSRRAGALATLSGAAIGLGIMAKLFDVVALVPAALYLAAPLFATFIDGRGRLRRPPGALLSAGLRTAIPALVALGVGLIVACAAVLLPFWPVRHELYDQVVRFHQAAEHTFLNRGWQYNVQQIVATLEGAYSFPYAALLLVAAGLALWRRSWGILPPLLWLLASLVLLIHQQPLLGHQIVLLAPPLALIAGLAFQPLRVPLPAPSRTRLRSVAMGALLVLLAAAVLAGLATGVSDDRAAAAPVPAADLRMARALHDATHPGDLVATDNQYIAGLADRTVLPQLVDTSQVRIVTGYQVPRYLSAGGVEALITRMHVRAILFASPRFGLIPGFHSWVKARYREVADFGGGNGLYLARGR